jgi:hypothetical protein
MRLLPPLPRRQRNPILSFLSISFPFLCWKEKRKVTTTNTTSKQMASCKIMTELQQFNFSKQSGATPSFNTEAKIRDSEGSIGEDFKKALDDVSVYPSQDLTTRLTLAFNCCRSRM